ncbi:hypothetical protein OEA41_000115 [Lepraria neglecta]|uniref:Azaphilone pigments biosynthesis cluster protein L N-terminal domain-containing protein n=1 Tax=Lepraria neglecta TaxID=209136 RepID=A0AAD9ZHZ7_9LECA|nr:hypothetical protein OEA41_000115 [Lepraria neglecta]
MAEVVGLAAGLLALTTAAYQTSKALHEAISSFRSQQKTIKDFEADSDSLTTVLDQIREWIQNAKDIERLEPLRQPIYCCMQACQEMHEMIDACTVHTTDARQSVRDWLNMQFRGKSFEETKQRLSSYKSTLSIAFNLSTITQDSLEQLKELISGTKEDLEDQLAQVQRHIETAEASLRVVLQDDQARLQSCLNSLAQVQQIANNIRPSVFIQDNRAGQGSRTIFGTDTSQPQFNLTVSGNEAQQDAVMGSGVYTPQTLQALLGDTRKGDLAFAVQALQTQTQSSDKSALQSIANQLTAERSTRTWRINPLPNLIDSDHTHTAEDAQPPPATYRRENSGRYIEYIERRSE